MGSYFNLVEICARKSFAYYLSRYQKQEKGREVEPDRVN